MEKYKQQGRGVSGELPERQRGGGTTGSPPAVRLVAAAAQVAAPSPHLCPATASSSASPKSREAERMVETWRPQPRTPSASLDGQEMPAHHPKPTPRSDKSEVPQATLDERLHAARRLFPCGRQGSQAPGDTQRLPLAAGWQRPRDCPEQRVCALHTLGLVGLALLRTCCRTGGGERRPCAWAWL